MSTRSSTETVKGMAPRHGAQALGRGQYGQIVKFIYFFLSVLSLLFEIKICTVIMFIICEFHYQAIGHKLRHYEGKERDDKYDHILNMFYKQTKFRRYIGIILSACLSVCAKFVSCPYFTYGGALDVLTSHKYFL